MSVGAIGITYFCCLFCEYKSNPYAASLAIKRPCLMQSKTLDRTVSSAPPKPPSSKPSFQYTILRIITSAKTALIFRKNTAPKMETADLVTFAEEMRNGKLHFL